MIMKMFVLLLSLLLLLFTGCITITKPIEIKPEGIKKHIPIQPTSLTEQIFGCLDQALELSAKELSRQHKQTKSAFIAKNTPEKRLELICLNLAHQDNYQLLEYAQNLIEDMPEYQKKSNPDIQGLVKLIQIFRNNLDQKLAEKNNVKDAASQYGAQVKECGELVEECIVHMEESEAEVEELKKQLHESTMQLEELKSIEKILTDRKND